MKKFTLFAILSFLVLLLVSCEKEESISDHTNESNALTDVFGPKVELNKDFASTMLTFESEDHFVEIYNEIARNLDSDYSRIKNLLANSKFESVQKVLQDNDLEVIFEKYPNLVSKFDRDGERYVKVLCLPSTIGLFLNEDAQMIIGEELVQFTDGERLSIEKAILQDSKGNRVDLRSFSETQSFKTTTQETNARDCSVYDDCEVIWLSGKRKTEGSVNVWIPSSGPVWPSILIIVSNYKKDFWGDWYYQKAGELGFDYDLFVNGSPYIGSLGPLNEFLLYKEIPFFPAVYGTCPSVSGSVTTYAHEHECTMNP